MPRPAPRPLGRSAAARGSSRRKASTSERRAPGWNEALFGEHQQARHACGRARPARRIGAQVIGEETVARTCLSASSARRITRRQVGNRVGEDEGVDARAPDEGADVAARRQCRESPAGARRRRGCPPPTATTRAPSSCVEDVRIALTPASRSRRLRIFKTSLPSVIGIQS